MGDTDKSDFGSNGGGKNCICHVIPNALRVPKMYILSMLERAWSEKESKGLSLVRFNFFIVTRPFYDCFLLLRLG